MEEIPSNFVEFRHSSSAVLYEEKAMTLSFDNALLLLNLKMMFLSDIKAHRTYKKISYDITYEKKTLEGYQKYFLFVKTIYIIN